MRFRIRPLVLVAVVLLVVPLLACTDILTIGVASDQWIDWAKVAWTYFDPGVGVNANTGLHYATLSWHRFTDWDLGVYVEAIIDAEKLGILSRDGDWGSNNRTEKVLSFLENRPLSGGGIPYLVYDADTGGVANDNADRTAHPSDSAKLLLALDDLRRFRPDLAERINSLVARCNFQTLANSSYFSQTNDIYPWYAAEGYHAFGYATTQLKDIQSLGDGAFVDVYGESLPKARITSEPLMLAVLEDRSTGLYRTYADRTFSAQQKRHEATGKLTAFSEGMYWYPQNYVYEWVVDANGEVWVIYAASKINAVPIVYTKIAFAFHAIYNNQYTSTLVDWLSSLQATSPLGGFYEGKSEEGPPLQNLTDKTNGMILAAARYYVTHTTTTSSTTSSVTTSSSSTTSSLSTETSMSTETTSATVVTVYVTVTYGTTATPESTVLQIVSNSSVSSLVFDSMRGLLNFTITGPSGSFGFFNATIAKTLLYGRPVLLIDGTERPAIVTEDANFWYIYATYLHSERHVTIGGSEIVPEFSQANLLLLMLFFLSFLLLSKRLQNERG